MDLQVSAICLVVHDLDQALGFYCGVLGLEVRGTAEDKARVSVGPPSQPGVRLVLELPGLDTAVLPDDRHAVEDLAAGGLLGRIGFVTGDCDATFECIEAAGAEVMQEPIDRPCGARDCAFLDPSGNMLRFTRPGQIPTVAASAPDTSRRAHEGATDA